MKYGFYKFCLSAMYATGVHYLASSSTRGAGVILMMTRVRPWEPKPFAPNRALEITPEFLDRVLSIVKLRGYDLIGLDDVPERLRDPAPSKPFVALTVDGAYRDLEEFALPVFKRHNAPFTVFVTTGFSQCTVPIWWIDLELAIGALSAIAMSGEDFHFEAVCDTPEAKDKVYERLCRMMRKWPEAKIHQIVAGLVAQANVDTFANQRLNCLSIDELKLLAQNPLATIGSQTLTHPKLAQRDYNFVRWEIGKSRAMIEDQMRRTARHFSFPFGDRRSAGMRDFYLAASAGYETAVTTRPGVLFPEHAEYLFGLPRLKLNGHFQSESHFEVLLSGLPFALYNRGRKLNVV